MNLRIEILRRLRGCENCSLKHYKEAVNKVEALVKKGWIIKQAIKELEK